jgi:hypothetical protein
MLSTRQVDFLAAIRMEQVMLRTRFSKFLRLPGEMMRPKIEEDIRRRLVLG